MKTNTRGLRICLLMSLVFSYAIVATGEAPVHLDRKGERWAASTLHKMTLEEKVGQMIMVWAHIKFLNVQSPDYLQLLNEMNKYHLGGFGVTVEVDETGLVKGEPFEAAFLTNSLQKQSKYPLLMVADFERGLSMRLNGATDFPSAMAFGGGRRPCSCSRVRKNLGNRIPRNRNPVELVSRCRHQL